MFTRSYFIYAEARLPNNTITCMWRVFNKTSFFASPVDIIKAKERELADHAGVCVTELSIKAFNRVK
jgi:hypothetical protein